MAAALTPTARSNDVAQVVVVGGGIAGLVTAYELSRKGLRPLVVEASATLGGTVSRHHVGGLALDAGAESFALATGAVSELIADLGLSDRVVQPGRPPAWVRHRSGAAPLPGGGWLGIPGRPTAGDVRRVIGWSGSVRALFDRLAPASVGRSAGSLGELVQRRLGRRVLQRLVEPVVGGVYSTDPRLFAIADLPVRAQEALRANGSLAAAARALRGNAGPAGSAVAGLRGGMYELVLALADAIVRAGGIIVTDANAESVESARAGYTTTVAWSAGRTRVRSRGVVIATPARQAGILLGLERSIGTAGSSVLLCTMVVRSEELDRAPRGSGVLVAADAPGVRAKALTHGTAKWAWLAAAAGPGRHVLRLSYGRGDGAELPAAQEFPDLARADAGDLLGVRLSADQVEDWALTSWSSVAERSHVEQAIPALRGRGVTGGWLAGTGLAAVVSHARRVADELATELTAGTGEQGSNGE